MKINHFYSSRFRILKGGKISLVVSALLGSVTLCFAAPSGGVVTSGNASISQIGKTTNINQSTSKASINWQKFGIKADEVVNFIQPNKNSITLNRVIGNERSIIDGALNANGQVWILNSNGVLFGKNASINTAGLLATTKELSDTDFQAGNFTFSGNSSESVINQGTIKIQDNGYVILASNEVRNSGTIEAIKGRVQLTGANEYTLNLNGNSLVDLVVDKGVLDALVENSGTILADGGEVYLTTHAVDELLRGVVNNTGIIEANSIDGLSGHVELYAHGGTANIDGTIKAKGGFIETSGTELNVASSTSIEASKWLLDPVNMTIESSGGNDLTGASVSATAIQNALVSADVELQADNSIFINEDIIWSEATRLTLTAGSRIELLNTIENTNSTYGGVYFNAPNVYFYALVPPPIGNGKVIIHNIHQLQWMNTALNGNYELGSNIDASDTRNWNSGDGFSPIGTFTGSLNGNGYIIDGLYINRPTTNNIGLFARVNGVTVSNLGLTNIDFTGNNIIGSIFGDIQSNSSISNSYATGKITGNSNIGGLVGQFYTAGGNNSIISNTYTNVDITGDSALGGLVGIALVAFTPGSSKIEKSYAMGHIQGNSGLGGIIGLHSLPIENSYYDSDTTGVNKGISNWTSAGITEINSSSAFTQSTYSGFDFTNDWYMIEGDTRPFLRNEYSTTITNDHQLQLMGMNLNANYILANDITYTGDMWSTKGFSPIGTFTGSLNGNGYIIDGLYINRPDTSNIGLFRTIEDATISNIELTNVDITGNHYVGGLIGRNYSSTIQNSFTTGDVSGVNSVGGLVGSDDVFSLVRNTYSSVDVSGNNAVGGLIGHHYDSTVENSYAIGNVSGNSNVGGLIGHWYDAAVRNTYYDRDTTGLTNGIGNGGRGGVYGIYSSTNTINAFDKATYAGFDFTNNWIIYEGHTRPLLRAFMTELTISANDHTRVYDGTTYSGSGGVSYSIPTFDSSLVYGTLNYTSSGDLKNAGTATVDINGLYSLQNGYIINYSSGTLTTNKKSLTANYVASDKVYDGNTDVSVNGQLSGVISGEDVSLSQNASFSDKNAGNNKTVNIFGITLNGADIANYTFDNSDTHATANITKKSLTANYVASDKVYDGTTDATIIGTIHGIISGDTVSYSNTSANFSDKNAGNGKTVTISGITLDGVDSANYSISDSTTATANISKKSISANYVASDKVYDGTTNAIVNGTLSGIISGEDVSLSQNASFSDKNAGDNKTVNIFDIALNGADIANYSFDDSDTYATANITKKSITANYVASDKIYDGTTNAIVNSTLSGIISGEDVSLLQNASFSDKNAGDNKTVNIFDIALNGADIANYTFDNSDTYTTANITKKSITANYVASDKIYDGTTNAIVNGTLSGVISGDSVYISQNANFFDENVGTNKTVIITNPILLGKDASNYELLSTNLSTKASISNPISSIINSIHRDNISNIFIPKENFSDKSLSLLDNGNTLIPIINGVALKVLNGGINLPYGLERKLSLDSDNKEDESNERENI